MNCAEFLTHLVEVLDGRLDATRAADAGAHLASCPSCRREADLHRRTWELAGRIDAIEPDASFAASVHRRVRRSRLVTIVGTCAAAAALVVALLFIRREAPASNGVNEVVRKMDPEDRRLLEELARDRTWELADNIDVIRALELLDNAAGAPLPEEDH